jgi:hypothetical protein
MAGYATSALIRGNGPHLAIHAGSAPAESWNPAESDLWHGGEPIELIGRPVDQVVAEWLASVGESWSQLTFFLFDPESWR